MAAVVFLAMMLRYYPMMLRFLATWPTPRTPRRAGGYNQFREANPERTQVHARRLIEAGPAAKTRPP